MPRSALLASGLLTALLGTLAGAALIAVPGGALVSVLGYLSWNQRRCGRMLVSANANAVRR